MSPAPSARPISRRYWSSALMQGSDHRRRRLGVGGVVIGQDHVEGSLLAHTTLIDPDGGIALAAEEIVAVAGEDDDACGRHELPQPLVGALRELCVSRPESLVEEQDVR